MNIIIMNIACCLVNYVYQKTVHVSPDILVIKVLVLQFYMSATSTTTTTTTTLFFVQK